MIIRYISIPLGDWWVIVLSKLDVRLEKIALFK